MQITRAALAYWGAIFAAGFVLGTMRVLWLVPSLGGTWAMLAELPVMLTASWIAARWLVRRFAIASAGQALAMGAMAFALLMASEAGLAVVIGEGVAAWLAGMASTAGAIGLAGQVVFGVMPVLVRQRA
jgi:hypothetical protein